MCAVLILCGVLPAPCLAQAAPTPGDPALEGTGRIHGKILASDGKTPVTGAVVHACYLDDERAFSSQPSGGSGEFEMEALPHGYVDLAVETPAGIFVANQVLNVTPGGKLGVQFMLTKYEERPADWWSGRERREVPCTGQSPTGVAELHQKVRGKEYFKTPAGIAILAGASGAALLAIAAGGGGGESAASPASPSQP